MYCDDEDSAVGSFVSVTGKLPRNSSRPFSQTCLLVAGSGTVSDIAYCIVAVPHPEALDNSCLGSPGPDLGMYVIVCRRGQNRADLREWIKSPLGFSLQSINEVITPLIPKHS